MAFQPDKDAEVAGYRLIEKIGAGGYGEVWKATAPAGLGKAVKIVYGDNTSPQAVQELRSLGRIKEVRHPFLLSLERVEVLDGDLIFVMELADGGLTKHFKECRDAGLRGIPRDELLSHLHDAASALDYMAQTHGLQHLDVKPQNLLLVGNRIKVADFGLVPGLGTTRVTSLGITPLYATPEAFDGRVSRNSDQYSLAIVYQEMLTGVRPFPGSTILELAVRRIERQAAARSAAGIRPAGHLEGAGESRRPAARFLLANDRGVVVSRGANRRRRPGQFVRPNKGGNATDAGTRRRTVRQGQFRRSYPGSRRSGRVDAI